MELYLQFGYGMMGHCEHLIQDWDGGTVILSPRDQSHEQMNKFVPKINRINGRVIFDPQFYLPHADHSRLVAHPFWPQDYSTALFNRAEIRRMLTVLKNEYNTPYQTPFFILPGQRSTLINDDWYNFYSILINEANELDVHNNIFLTLCLSHEAMMSEDTIHALLEYLDTWNVQGCYIVAEPPQNNYLIDNPNWLVNLMDISAGIKLQGKKVIVGYSNHQSLCLGLSKVDAIASGNWLNVRSFNINKFNNPDDGASRRSTWYYCPQALSEYQVPFLDIARRLGVLDDLKTSDVFQSNYSDILFSGAQPTAVNYTDRESFRHYLQCLKTQASDSVKETYHQTKESIRIRLETAERLTSHFSANGVRGKARDFSDYVDASLSSIDVFDRLRGMILNHNWENL